MKYIPLYSLTQILEEITTETYEQGEEHICVERLFKRINSNNNLKTMDVAHIDEAVKAIDKVLLQTFSNRGFVKIKKTGVAKRMESAGLRVTRQTVCNWEGMAWSLGYAIDSSLLKFRTEKEYYERLRDFLHKLHNDKEI